jgi:ankyrin repeat protein
VVKHLLAAGADPSHRNAHGFTALRCAVGTPPYDSRGARQAECVLLLIKAGADPNATDNSGGTPLSSAAWFGSGPAMEVLLKAGADPKHRDSKGRTPADRARERGHEDLARMLG